MIGWILFILFFLLFLGAIFVIRLQRMSLEKLVYNVESLIAYSEDLKLILGEFNTHLEAFNSMEIYVGEPVVEELVKHSKFVVEKVNEINSMLQFIEEEK